MKTYYADLADTAKTTLTKISRETRAPKVVDFWVLSDLHLGHERLEEGGPLNGVRPENCSQLLTERWNQTVATTDDVLVLGDVLVGWPLDEYPERMPTLNGRIVVVAGNHESKGKIAFLKERGWGFVEPFEILFRDWLVFFTHEPMPDDELLANAISVHGHIHHRPERTDHHINTSAEAMDYRPQRLRQLLDRRIDQLGPPPF